MHNEILDYCREDMLSMLDFISGFGPEAFFKLISKVDPTSHSISWLHTITERVKQNS